jgi:hypothetical protein
MGWAKFEEDNREARNERMADGNFFWIPYTGPKPAKPDYGKTAISYPQNVKPTPKKKTYVYGY